MSDLSYTLLGEGSSDRALTPILTWTLREQIAARAIQAYWADLWRLPERPRTLADKIEKSVQLYPCDLLFVHRDADGEEPDARVDEIAAALAESRANGLAVPVVCVVPVRTTEAWLLIDEMAIRNAVGNPNGRQPLNLPSIARIQNLPNPKQTLYDSLRIASGLGPRRLRSFHPGIYAPRVSEHINDFAVLRNLSAFNSLEAEVQSVVQDNGWDRE